MRFSKLLILLTITTSTIVNGQIGTEFWFAAPDVSQSHDNNSIPLMLHVTALFTTQVTISRPADPSFTPVVFNLGPQQTQTTRLDLLLTVDQIEVYARDTSAGNFKQNKGFLVTAFPGEITAYYEVTGPHVYNTDIISLKSKNALGRDFWVSTQRKYRNHGYSDDFSGFVVVATQDGTKVNINPNGNILQFPAGAAPFSVTLNRGQTFAIRAAGQAAAQHIHGIKVTSNNDIAITIFDDSMQINDGGGNWDIFADQLVPTPLVGYEYIVLKGNVQDQAANLFDGEAIFITPTQNNTNIFIDGVLVAGPLNAGAYFEYKIDSLATHVRATQPIYVNHITGYSTVGTALDDPAGTRELGGAILPTIDGCTGSHSVTVMRTPATGFAFFNNLMVRNDTLTGSPTRNQAIFNFTYSINGGAPIPINPNHFTYIMDSAFAIYDRYKAGGAAYYNTVVDGQVLRVDNPMNRFHLGVMQGIQSPGCKYGYFSDYAASDASAGIGGFTQGNSDIFCNINPIRIVAGGGTSYKWYAPFDPPLVNKLDYDTVAAPYFSPDSSGIYYFNVVVTGECQSKDTLPVEIIVLESTSSSFSFSSDEGCSPFAPTLTNLSDSVVGVNQVWTVYPAVGSAYQINQDTIPRIYDLPLPENHTDSIQTHTISLVVKGPFNSCPSQKSKDINVKPQIEAAFTASDTIGCHPLFVSFDNKSTGNLDDDSYNWDFGDNTQAFDSLPTKNYTNYKLYDSTYIATLITESPFGCTDTASQKIIVHPRIRINLAADSTSACSPLVSNLNPSSSIGVDTLWWKIDYFYGDSTYKTTSKAPVKITHYDTSTSSGPDTLYVQLIGSNRMGCMDTAITRQLIVYPDVISKFTITDNDVCDLVPITFDNNSTGYQLQYDWDFGNNTYKQDSTGESYTRAFYNRTDNDTVYTVRLTATSGYFCSDVMDTNITVHPYIKADFGLSFENNCSPLSAQLTNTSIRADVSFWDFGTGTLDTIPATTINRNFINPYSNKDTTIVITLIVRNTELCYDTLSRSLVLFPQVVADFDFTADSVGCAPLNVGLENKSTGGSLLYTWDFGNGSSSTNSSPSFSKLFNNVSPSDTIYNVQLTARNMLGCDSVVTRPVEVFAFVDAEFNLPVVDSCSPFRLRPDNLSSLGAKVFNWDFGDGNTSTDFEPIVPSYVVQDETVKNYNVQLVAAGAGDAAHLACADTHIVAVTVFPELEADFLLSDTLSCQPLITNFTNNTNLIPGTSFSWYVGNNFYSTNVTPPNLTKYNYQNTDTSFTVKLFGRSQYNCRDTATQNIYIYSNIEAFFSLAPSAICSADSFQIDQTYTNGGITYRHWDFNGEDTSNIATNKFYHVFENLASASPVKKEVTLTVYNSHNCPDVWKDTVTVYPEVTADFTPDINTVCYPHISSFTNSSINASQAYWLFGDGSSSIAPNPVHKYNNFYTSTDRTFKIKLTATSVYSCADTMTKLVTILAKPNADFTFPVAVACPPFTAEMQNSSQGSNLLYNWDFAGEGTSTILSPSFTFSNSGSSIADKTIRLIVTSDKSCADTLDKTVSVFPDVNVDFNYTINEGCSPLEVKFTGDTSNVLQMLWYIDGKAFSTLKDPTYRFVNETPGTDVHDIKFAAYSFFECSADTTKQITVFPTPIAEFIPSPLPADYGTALDQTPITFYNETVFQDSWSYEWNFGDGNITSEASKNFEYVYGPFFWGANSNKNQVPVELVAWNTLNPECRDTTSHNIIIYPPMPQVDLAEDISGCQPFTVDFSAITKYIDDNDYQWEFGIEGETSTEPEPTYTFNKAGVYSVKLIVKGEGGSNWDYKLVSVSPKPVAAFAFNDSVVYDSSQTKGYDWINFYNQTSYSSGTTSWKWYFDAENNLGGIPDSEKRDPSWYYTETGEYYVGLIVESGVGCLDTLVHPTPIKVLSEGYVVFPTAFLVSPDGPSDEYDTRGRNKYVFYPLNAGVEEYHLEIYNRWGARIFNTKDVNQGWNGYIDGSPAKQDVYIWRVRGYYTNGQPYDMSGDVTLILGKDEVVQ
jgi:PKD repeat protein